MRDITVINLSDIHLRISENYENQGLVFSGFFEDLKDVVKQIPVVDRYCLISGDLVQNGGNSLSYSEFKRRFLTSLSEIVPIMHIICIPGNHDINRNYIESHYAEYQKFLSSQEDESSFNELVKKDEYFKKLFAPYQDFVNTSFNAEGQSLFSFTTNVLPEISVMCVNTAILSNGGLDQDGAQKHRYPKDIRNLRIETSALFEWAEKNDGRTKVLVMHHPKENLTEYAQTQLEAVINNSVDIYISGHEHFQKYEQLLRGERVIHKLSAPQLFSNKRDLNGYALLHFSGANLSSIEYRQWSSKNYHFNIGIDFADNTSGIIEVHNRTEKESNNNLLLTKWEQAMLMYGHSIPWCERWLSSSINKQPSQKKDVIDYLDIINSNDNFQIIAPPQFGLTSLGYYLSLRAYEIKCQKWAYVDFRLCTLGNIDNKIRLASSEVGFSHADLSAIVIDNWNSRQPDRQKVLDKVSKMVPGIRIILMTNMLDSEVLAGLDTEESHLGFKLYYLRELSRSATRTLVEFYNNESYISEPDILLERLLTDIDTLNVHRTPLNCLQLLFAYKNNFDAHPVNRSRVLQSVLNIIFMNSNTMYYNGALDEKDCCNIMGVISYKLFFKDTDCFTWVEFKNSVFDSLQTRYTEAQIKELLEILVANQILTNSVEGYRFHFAYWVYYFVAYRLFASDDCFEEMMVKGEHFFNPDIVEFYTAINDKSDQLVNIIVARLNQLTGRVNDKIGRPFWNPYQGIKWNLKESADAKTNEQIENEVKASRLPEDIKDVIKDQEHDCIRPYNQPIQRVFTEYEVSSLMKLAQSASRALRNGHLVEEGNMLALRDAIYGAWVELFKVLILIAPALASTGYGGYGGARFKLEGDFSKEIRKCILEIICAIPFNIINWYKDDFFSEKRVLMYKDAMLNNENPVIRHINARLIVECRPQKWKEMVSAYIGTIDKNTFFLGDIDSALRRCYSMNPMTEEDLRITRGLIITCYTKHKGGSALPSVQAVNKNADKVTLPKRLTE